MADPELLFPQSHQKIGCRKDYDDILERKDEPGECNRGEGEQIPERKGKQLGHVQMLIRSVLKGYGKGDLYEFDHTGCDKNGVKNRYQKPLCFFIRRVPWRVFSELAVVDFRQVREDDEEHHRVFDAVEIGPEDTQEWEQPDLVPSAFQDIEKDNDKQVGEKMGPYQQFPVHNQYGAADKKGKPEQQFCPVFTPMDKKKRNAKGGQGIEKAPQGDQAVIPCRFKDLVYDGLKQPVVVVPMLGRCDVGEEGIVGNGSVLPEISATGEMIPKVCVVHHDGPGDEIADQHQKEQGDKRYRVVSIAGNGFKEPAERGF